MEPKRHKKTARVACLVLAAAMVLGLFSSVIYAFV